MPKMKTHSGAKKRLSFTGTGKIRRARAFHQHNFRHKSTRQNRQLRKSALVRSTEAPRMARLLPYGS
jgi:large subunit ribosomal protein L35